jgi:hypothetical protein
MNHPAPLNRRTFVKTTCMAGAAAAIGNARLSWPLLRAAEEPVLAPPKPSWVDRPMRWAQLTLAEDDPGKFDLSFWLDLFQRTRSDAVCLSAGRCGCWPPTNTSTPRSPDDICTSWSLPFSTTRWSRLICEQKRAVPAIGGLADGRGELRK